MSPEFDVCISVNAGELPWSLTALSPKWSLDRVWKFHLGNNYSNALPPNQVSFIKNHFRPRPLQMAVGGTW